MPNQYHNLGWLLITLSNYDFSFYILESRLCGTYIPILYALNFLVYSSFVSLSFEL